MKPVGLAFAFIGYTLVYFGWCSVRGPGVGLLDLVVPGRTVVVPTAGGGGGQPSNQVPGATTNQASLAWIQAHPCVFPNPDRDSNDFWNGVAVINCKKTGGVMQAPPANPGA